MAVLQKVYLPFTHKDHTIRTQYSNSQYSRREVIELNHVPADITGHVSENICKALSLIGVNVISNDSHSCNQLKRSDSIIIKFKYCKQKNNIIKNAKNRGTTRNLKI